jgi:arsenite methyltransferase
MQIDLVKEYYGQTLKSTADLRTSACCTPDAVPAYLKPLMANIHDAVTAKYYGCDLLLPAALRGARVLDLGSGSGRDAYLAAQLVGPDGEVVGVDMTLEQLETARAYLDWHRKRFGYSRSNVRFIEGYLEKLDALGLQPASFDVILSNCVINLCIDKPAVFKGAFDLLKPGGELYFSDVYADRRLPDRVRADPILYGECLGGALYWNDFRSIAKGAGFGDPRLVMSRSIEITDETLKAKLGSAKFYAATYRLFRLDGLEPASEDYGQAVIYKGGLVEQPDIFVLDQHHQFAREQTTPVNGNIWRTLKETRFAPHFKFVGDFSTHYGAFPDPGANIPCVAAPGAATTACGSCS